MRVVDINAFRALAPFPAPCSQAITPPAPHTAAPLEPQAQLLDGGDARGEWLALVRSEPGVGPLAPTTVIAPEPDALCSLCDDYGPRVAYHQPGGQVLRLHAACQAIWLAERDRPR